MENNMPNDQIDDQDDVIEIDADGNVVESETAGSSFGDVSKTAKPTGVRAKKLKGSKDQGDLSGPPAQGSSQKATFQTVEHVTADDIDVKDDVDAAFEGQEVSEDFKAKVAGVMAAAIATKVNEKIDEISDAVEGHVDELDEEADQFFAEKLDSYLDVVVERWMSENKLAVNSGLRAEIAESFLTGLRGLFEDSYIEVPDDKIDVFEQMATQFEELKDSYTSVVEELAAVKKQVDESAKASAVAEAVKDLTDVQKEKIVSLAEAVVFEDADKFAKKITDLKEGYFPSLVKKPAPMQALDEGALPDLQEKVVDPNVDPAIARLGRQISALAGQ